MADEATAPRRLRAQDVIDAQQRTIEQLTTRSAEPYVSCERSRNAKGETQIVTKVSAPAGTDPDELAALVDMVEAQDLRMYEKATARHPAASGFVTNAGPVKGSGDA